MPFLFTCPNCQHQVTVDENYVGRSGPCASCGKVVTVVAPTPTAPHQRQQARSEPRPLMLAGIFLGALVGAALLVALVVALVMFAVPLSQNVQSNAAQSTCAANLIAIGRAMLEYQADHGTFPPAFVADEKGTPLHSWRVLLLPYLGQNALYQRYDMKLPWNSPPNLELTYQMPPVFACPDSPNAAGGETNYMAVVGPGMVFQGATSASLAEIRDGTATTILLVETAGLAQNWLEPLDLDRRQLNMSLNTGLGREIGSYHPAGGANVLLVDGSVKFLSDLTPPQVIESMLTINGGETVAP
ncbi:MAG: DUF1559 domain-containing protein [Planctomycetales bacterium]|nr:DUF1559 domain-containing protein [Planctomycetales bacterium]